MQSMTGYGQAEGENARFSIAVTLRAVNHRFFDLALRLREEHRSFEVDLRERLGARLHRGRIEAIVNIEPRISRPVVMGFDDDLAVAVQTLARDLASRGLIAPPQLTFSDVLRIPDLVRLEARELAWEDDDRELLMSIVDRAVEQLIAARGTEGAKLASTLTQRIEALGEVTTALTAASAGMPAALAESLRRRIDELLSTEVPDADRLAQEVAYLVDKSDVSEELDRLRSHLDHFSEVMARPGSIGKRLDFLAQEILRELNTVGSKCRDSVMTRSVLDGKVLCEQVREQVQNVE